MSAQPSNNQFFIDLPEIFMQFTHLTAIEKRKPADLLVLPFWKLGKGIQVAFSIDKSLFRSLESILATEDFTGKEDDLILHYVEGQPERRIALLGLGAKAQLTKEKLRRSYGALIKRCFNRKIEKINLVIPDQDLLTEEDLISGISEGLFLSDYLFSGEKQVDSSEDKKSLLNQITWIGSHKHILNTIRKTALICEAVHYTQDLVNGNADDITPQHLAQCAKELAAKNPLIQTTVFDKKRIEKEQMRLLLAVGRGSSVDPTFIIMKYVGHPNSKDHTVVVGKGVTYDTGGLNIKPTGGMETMKCDMAGGAACLGIISAVAQLNLPINLTIVIPSTENSVDACSFKPGDVYKSYSGKSVEMTNSDAEGRLILADALAYACKKLHPTRLMTIATLTGAIEVALGAEASGLMSTSDELASQLIESGEATFERVWRMPLYEEYKEKLKSDIADLKSWNGRSGSSSVAATFLRQFVDESIPWAHLDIAATAFLAKPRYYHPKYATGVGVRLIVDFLEKLKKN